MWILSTQFLNAQPFFLLGNNTCKNNSIIVLMFYYVYYTNYGKVIITLSAKVSFLRLADGGFAVILPSASKRLRDLFVVLRNVRFSYIMMFVDFFN